MINAEKRKLLLKDISHSVNKLSLENHLNMADDVIAEMMVNMLESVIQARDTTRARRISNRLNALMDNNEEIGEDLYLPRVTIIGEDLED